MTKSYLTEAAAATGSDPTATGADPPAATAKPVDARGTGVLLLQGWHRSALRTSHDGCPDTHQALARRVPRRTHRKARPRSSARCGRAHGRSAGREVG